MDANPDQTHQTAGYRGLWRKLNGLLIAQAFGQFNDQAWKQVVTLLAMAMVTAEAAKQAQTAKAQIVLMIPLMLFSLPGGLLADRVGKRSVIVWTKLLELALLLAGTAALVLQPEGGLLPLAVLGLLGIQAALFIPVLGMGAAARNADYGARIGGGRPHAAHHSGTVRPAPSASER